MNRTVVVLSLALALAAVGCREQQSLTSPQRLSADFSDGTRVGGNPNFFFLPPLVGQPSFSGIFNPNLAPVVKICQLDVNASGTPIGCNATAPLIDPGPVLLDAVNQQYQVDWHTDAPAIDLTKFFRIQVFISNEAFNSSAKPLGFADIAPVANGSQVKNVNTGQYIGLVDGRTLPIKVRIEQGATCIGQTDCVEKTFGPSTTEQHVVTPSGFAGVSAPGNYFTETVTLTIHRIPEPCLNTPFQQVEGCYSFATSPLAVAPACQANPTSTSACARVEVCVLVSSATPLAHVALFRSDPGLPATELPEVPNSLITCTLFGPFPTLGLGPHRTADLASATWHRMGNALRRLLGPEPLFARSAMGHLGLGGLSCCFSNFGWALPATITPQTPTNSTAPTGATVPVSVRVGALHPLSELPPPLSGVPVTFAATPGNGAVNPVSVTTGSDGIATTLWTLGTGSNTVQASAAASGSPVTFTAIGTLLMRPSSVGLTALGGVTLPLTARSGLSMQGSPGAGALGTGMQLEVSPATAVAWSSSDPFGTTASVNSTGLLAVLQGNVDPNVAHQATISAAVGAATVASIKVNSFSFDHFPRLTTLVWRPIAGAASYDVHIQFGNGCTAGTANCTTWSDDFAAPPTVTSPGNSFVFPFVGAQPGRWWVVAKDATGAPITSGTSETIYFGYII